MDQHHDHFFIENVHYRLEWIKCGKRSCTRCPHGPYWYAYVHRGVTLKKSYVGRYLSEDVVRRGPSWAYQHLRPAKKKGTDSCAT
jgi:hypothetical protein